MKIISSSLIIVFLLVINFVYAQCGTAENPCTDNWEHFEYGNKNADITNVPVDKIDVGEAIKNKRIKDLNNRQTDALINEIIDNDGGKQLNSKDIGRNIEKIPDLNKIDNSIQVKYALQREYGIDLSYRYNSKYFDYDPDNNWKLNVENGILKTTVISNSKTQVITLNYPAYKEGTIDIDTYGKIKFYPKDGIDEEKLLSDLPYEERVPVKSMDTLYLISDNQRLKIENDKVIIPWGLSYTLKGLDVVAEKNDVEICATEPCSGNYVYIKDKLKAGGKGVQIRTSKFSRAANHFFDTFNSNNFLSLRNGEKFVMFQPQNDFLKIDIGSSEKNGYIEVNPKNEFLPAVVKSTGYIEIENNDNIISVDNKVIRKKLILDETIKRYLKSEEITFSENEKPVLEYEDSEIAKYNVRGYIDKIMPDDPALLPKTDSVSMFLITEESPNNVYAFDENHAFRQLEINEYEDMNNLRKSLHDEYNIQLLGYYSINSLNSIGESFNKMSNEINLDPKKINFNGYPLTYLEGDLKYIKSSTLADVWVSTPFLIRFAPDITDINNPPENNVALIQYDQKLLENSIDTLEVPSHEVGHVIHNIITLEDYGDSFYYSEKINDFQENHQFMNEYGDLVNSIGGRINVVEREKGEDNPLIISDNLVPSDYSKKNIFELYGELFKTYVNNPEWFDDPNINFKKSFYPFRSDIDNSEEVLEKRQKLKKFVEKSIERFKKD
ncbi:MAG TPA: hypothetical protein QGI22_04780 [Candidatus Woesearchaeota archaeon]|jgi:hypothetical protein|nr:hypothetical protein [Candidatus Woesearchaeota archaeon]HJN57246.1 hypothetical protein [Candidatus Woesearchaeota archaeon]|tara:strand:+ start:13334 stop:15502 length:2169 start_codon:yes stop_codon:yes gene_type:complete